MHIKIETFKAALLSIAIGVGLFIQAHPAQNTVTAETPALLTDQESHLPFHDA